NARANWFREGDKVVVESLWSGERKTAHLLKDAMRAAPPDAHGATHSKLSCAACHGGQGPRCEACHMTYDRSSWAQDYIQGAADFDPKTTRQRTVFTKGEGVFSALKYMTW